MTTRRPERPPLVVVSGPTAAGKTGLAIDLAKRFGGEIVNADSMQVYRWMDVGTAKPTLAQRAEVPHHAIDIVPPDAPYSAGRFARDAREAAEGVRGRGGVVFLVGGTGLYIRAYLEGLSASTGRDPELRRALEEEHRSAVAAGDPERLHRRLGARDPETAARLHPNDAKRIVRALELERSTGLPPSELRRRHPPERRERVLPLVVDPGRDALRGRIDRRCEAMIEGGLLQEVRALRERGYGPELPSMQAIGYRHMQPVVEGRETLEGVLRAMRRDTHRLARRQRTWWRRVPDAVWVRPEDEGAIAERVARFLEAGEAPQDRAG